MPDTSNGIEAVAGELLASQAAFYWSAKRQKHPAPLQLQQESSLRVSPPIKK